MGKLLTCETAVNHFSSLPECGSIQHCSMSSDVLGVDKNFSVYLPFGYEASGQTYPVLYLFHPGGGTDESWITLGHLPEIANDVTRSGTGVPMIIVMPDGSGEGEHHMGKHMGFFSVPDWDYEKFMITELIPLIDSTYRTKADKQHRAITGVSMGGEAAISYAQKYPASFGAACAMSGILGHPEESKLAGSDKDYAQSLIVNNPSAFVEKATPDQLEQLRTIRWFTDCGDRDYFIDGNTEFFLAMRHKAVPLDYRMRSGVHGWYYWITGLGAILQFLSIGFAK